MLNRVICKYALLSLLLCFGQNLSADEGVNSRLDSLEQVIEDQAKTLQQQRQEIRRLREAIDERTDTAGQTAVDVMPVSGLDDMRAGATPTPVGQAPEARREAPSSLLSLPEDVGGVLTKKGKIVVEPSFQFSSSQLNRFTFRGIEIIDTVLIGIVDAEDADRDTYTASLTGRYGLTNRIELEAKVPVIKRDDRLVSTIDVAGTPTDVTRDLDGSGVGDIELGAHYQINQGADGWPFFIGNLRYKSTTGDGPFDISRDAGGLETELPTGSGFHSIEPSVTILYPTAPAVLFANVGYLFTLEDDVNKMVGTNLVGNVDPGDALRLSFGMAYSVNERLSFTVGYKHDFIGETDTVINGVNTSTADLDVGSFTFGYGFQLSPKLGINLGVEIGATDDAPDATVTLRLPYSI